MGKTQEFIKNVVKYCIPSIISALIGLIAIPIISGIYPADDYGKINLFYSVGNMLMYIVLLGLDSAYIRFYFEPPKGLSKDNLFSIAFVFGFLNTLIMTLIIYVFFSDKASYYLFGEAHKNLLILMSMYVLGLIMFRLLSIETRMENQAFLFNVQQILLIITNRVSFVLVAFYSTNYKYSIFAISICSIFIGIIFLLFQKKKDVFELENINLGKIRYLMKFALPLMPATVMTWVNNSAAKMVLSGYKDYNLVGILSIATSLANVFSIVSSAFCTYWSPYMYSNYKKEQDFIKKVHNVVLLVSIVVILIIFCFQDVLYLFVNGEYKDSQKYFLLIMLSPIQQLLCETTFYGVNIANKTIYNLYISIIAGIFNVIACIWLYPKLNIWGIIIGISGAAIFQLISKTLIGQKYYESIVSKKTTFLSYLLMIIIAISNIFMFKYLILRIIVSITIIILCMFFFKSEIKTMKSLLFKKS